MNLLEQYMKLPYRLEITPDYDEGGYMGNYAELPGCASCADSIEELVINMEDAKKQWLLMAIENEMDIPMPLSDNEYSGQFKLRIPKSLHRRLAERSKEEGISMNQYCLYLLAKNM